MQEIVYIERILNSDFLQKGDGAFTMVEPSDLLHDEQRVDIKNDTRSILDMKLYCFNTADKNVNNLFPFFNQRSVEPKAPEGLNRFCDYILLVQHIKGLFVFFLEMKRGDTDGADKQIEASCTFFDFILQSAERIREENGLPDFDSNKVQFRRIIIKEERSNKRMTKDNEVENFDLEAVNLHKCHSEFRPVAYCR